MTKIKIKEPWWSAYKKFNWPVGTWGVGINKREVDSAALNDDVIELQIWKFKQSYPVSARAIQEFAKMNNCTYTAKAGTKLYVVPAILLNQSDEHSRNES